MIEIAIDSMRGFAYGKESLEELNCYRDLNYKIERTEILNNIPIYTLIFKSRIETKTDFSYINIGKIYCPHGYEIRYKTINRLPRKDWEEQIDCWSCHSNEFKSLLSLKICPRKDGILVSNFYCIPDPSLLPMCCSKRKQYFFNELKIDFNIKKIIYLFFEDFFSFNPILVLEKPSGESYSIKFFYKCVLLNDSKKNPALKICFRVNNNTAKPKIIQDDFINEEIKDEIIKQLIFNSLKIKVMGFEMSYITYV